MVKLQPFKLQPTIGLDNMYTFGIEIEFTEAPLDDIKNIGDWQLKDEINITEPRRNRMYGGELISPILKDDVDNWKDVTSKCKKLVKYGARVSDFTGGHIHIGSQIVGEDPNNIRRFLKLWELFENIIYYFSYGYDDKAREAIDVYADAIGNKFKKIRKTKHGYEQFKSFYDWIQYFKKLQVITGEGISFKKFRSNEEDIGNTIEIRCPNGTLDPIIWQNNINFFTRLLLSSHEDKCDEELLDYLLRKKEKHEYELSNFDKTDLKKAILLSDMIYDDEVHKLLFLKQYLKLFTPEENKNHSL